MRYAAPLEVRLPAWQMPKGIIRDPLSSFTVVRGLDGLLADPTTVREWLGKVPEQATGWAMAGIPFQVYWAAPMTDTARRLAALEPRMREFASNNFPSRMAGVFSYTATNATLNWDRLPFIAPYAMPIQVGGQEYLFAGLFPNPVNTNPPPPELFAMFQQKSNVVYYDWEITQDRLVSLRQLTQLGCVIAGRLQAGDEGAGWLWLPEVAARLGNTVTEVTLNSPSELGITRRGHLGLTGSELTLLVRLLDWKEFPEQPWSWLKPNPIAFNPPSIRARTNAPASKP
jgi:hypothetical protein